MNDIDYRLEQVRLRLGETYPDGFGVLAGKEMWHGLGCAYQASSSTGDDCDCFRSDIEFLLDLLVSSRECGSVQLAEDFGARYD